MSPGVKLSRSREILRNGGVKTLWFKMLGETIYRRILLFKRELNNEITTRSIEGIEFGQLVSGETSACVDLRPEHSPAVFIDRINRGDQCTVARRSGKVIAMAWSQKGLACIDYLDDEIELGTDEHYIFEVTVATPERGDRIASGLYTHLYHRLRELGAKRAVFAVNFENPAGLRGLTRNGEEAFAVHGYFSFGPWRRRFRRSTHEREWPGSIADSHGVPYWDDVARTMARRPSHYLDDTLAELKCRAYGRLLQRWTADRASGPVLKTDVFEEANLIDALIPLLPNGDADCIGMDVSPETAGNAAAGGVAPGTCYLSADIRQLPFGNQSFSLVFSPSTLDHFTDAADLGRSLVEIKRVLAPNGRLVITLDNKQNVLDPLLRLLGHLGFLPYYLGRSYTVGNLVQELESSGFDVLDTASVIQHPRLLGVVVTGITNWLGWQWLQSLTRRSFLWGERFESSRWKFFTGCFVAALAVPRKTRLDCDDDSSRSL